METSAPFNTSVPVGKVTHSPPLYRSFPFTPPKPAKRPAIASSPSRIKLTPKRLTRDSIAHEEDVLLIHTMTLGGSAENDDTEVATNPVRSPSWQTVISEIAPASSRMAILKSFTATST